MRSLRALFLMTLIGLFVSPVVAIAQEEVAPADPDAAVKSAITTLEPSIPLDQLRHLVKPLTRAELEVEAEAWRDLLRLKARDVAAAQLKGQRAAAAFREAEDQIEATPVGDPAETVAALAEAEASAEEVVERSIGTLAVLHEQRTALGDRLNVVLTSLEAKGGETEEYRQYMTAVSGLDIDTQNVNATWEMVTTWMRSKEGGLRVLTNILKFLAILIVSWIAAKIVAGMVNWLLDRKVRLSQLAENLISRTIKNVILLIGFAIGLTALEIDITPILATIGATGFIVGFALQGTLSNFASGLMILLNRPFDVGDVVSAGGITGKVDQMNLVSTTFRTFDNQSILVPNNEIWGSVITNITANSERRVDLEFGIGYDDSFEQAEAILLEVCKNHPLVLEDPEPTVMTHALGDSCVMIVCRPWAKTEDNWTVRTEITREVKRRFDEAGIAIPYPQQDIHIYQHTDG